MPDVQIDPVLFGHLERRSEAFGCRELRRVLDVRMAVHRHQHLVLLRKRRDLLGHRKRRRSGNQIHPERLREVEAAVDLLVGKAVVETIVVRDQLNTGIVELLLDFSEVAERYRGAPLPQLFPLRLTLHAGGLDMTAEQFTYPKPLPSHGRDGFI